MSTSKNKSKNWKILSQKTIHNVENIVDILLHNRGIIKKNDRENFLHPPKPQDLTLKDLEIDKKEIQKAIHRVKQAKENKESVVVYTDYDVDGVCGGTIIWETLHRLGIKVMPYIPHRVEEGYGLSQKGIDKVKKEYNPALIITVDHGITAAEKIKYAQKLGIDIIVIDHHAKRHPPAGGSPANILIHTTRLCATGVAWAFIRELTPKENYLDLVALATIADLVPLIGPNRSLVKYGLEKLNTTKRIGLEVLIKSAGLEKGAIGVYEVGHMLAPRINAMGRILHALDAMRLLCTKDEDRAKELATKMNFTNKKRQLITTESLIHAKNLYLSIKTNSKLIYIAHESYNQGVIGLIAGKLVEEYYLPAIVIAKGEIYSKASARSIKGFNIVETIRKAEELLVDCGGHPMAAGFTVKTEHIETLQKKLEKFADKEINDELLTHTLKIDCQLDIQNISWEFEKKLQLLEPFGIGNPEPLFTLSNVYIEGIRLMGKDNKHIKLLLSSGNKMPLEAVGFGLGNLYTSLLENKRLDIAFTVDENVWNGEKKVAIETKRC